MGIGRVAHPGVAPACAAQGRPWGGWASPGAGGRPGLKRSGSPTGPRSPGGSPHESQRGPPSTFHHRPAPHATCALSVSAGGGTPARGMRAVHTSGCPQTGHRAAGASPHASPARGPSRGVGSATGPWPPCCRHRIRTALAGGPCRRQRPMNCSRGRRMVCRRGGPPGLWGRSSYPKVTGWP